MHMAPPATGTEWFEVPRWVSAARTGGSTLDSVRGGRGGPGWRLQGLVGKERRRLVSVGLSDLGWGPVLQRAGVRPPHLPSRLLQPEPAAGGSELGALTAPPLPAARRGVPGGDRVRGEPELDVAAAEAAAAGHGPVARGAAHLRPGAPLLPQPAVRLLLPRGPALPVSEGGALDPQSPSTLALPPRFPPGRCAKLGPRSLPAPAPPLHGEGGGGRLQAPPLPAPRSPLARRPQGGSWATVGAPRPAGLGRRRAPALA